MMGKKALIIRRASLRREDIPMRIMNQEKGIAKEKFFDGTKLALEQADSSIQKDLRAVHDVSRGTIHARQPQMLVPASSLEFLEGCRPPCHWALRTLLFQLC